MIATKREAVLSFAAFALFVACAKQSSSVPADATPASRAATGAGGAHLGKSRCRACECKRSATLATQPATPAARRRRNEDGAAPLAPLVPAKRKAARAQTESDCKACNGTWGVHGISPTPSCNCRTSDAGKRCRDGIECEGLCTAAETPERQVTDPGPPARGFLVGRCSAFATVFGCYRPIDNGAGAKPVELSEMPQMICAD